MDQRERELRSTRGRGRRCDRGEVLQVLGGFGEGIQVRLGANMSRFASGPFPSSLEDEEEENEVAVAAAQPSLSKRARTVEDSDRA